MAWSLSGKDDLGNTVTASDGPNGTITTSATLRMFLDRNGIGLYDDVTDPGVIYTAKGFNDPIAGYLNILTSIPGEVKVTGTPPEGTPELWYGDCYGGGAIEDGWESGPFGKLIGTEAKMQTKVLVPTGMSTPHDSAMVALIPDADSVAKLFVSDGMPMQDYHLTLSYLGDADRFTEDQADILAAVIRSSVGITTQIQANVSGAGLLGPTATVYLVGDSDHLERIKKRTIQTVNDITMFTPIPPYERNPWIAHISAGENLDVNLLKYRGPVTFDRVRVAFGGMYYDFPLAPDDGPEMAVDGPIALDTPNGTVMAVKSFSDDPDTFLGDWVSGGMEAKDFHVGQLVRYHYRSAIGHGRIEGVAKQGKDSATTMYKIEEFDHHVSATGSREGKYVYHYGSALTAESSSSKELAMELEDKAVSPGGRPIDYSSLNRSPKKNWVDLAGGSGLPAYIRGVARGIAKSRHGGVVTSRDIATAISRMKVWAAGGQHVRPAVQAAAAAAVAAWEALKARSGGKATKAWESLLETKDDDVTVDDDALDAIIEALS